MSHRVKQHSTLEATWPSRPWHDAFHRGPPIAEERKMATFACADCMQLADALRKCLEAMVMQENRENESFHITQPNARAIWDEAKAAATKAFADTSK